MIKFKVGLFILFLILLFLSVIANAQVRFPNAGVKTTPAVGGVGTALNFTTVTGTFVQSPTGTWGSGTGHGITGQMLPASTDAYIMMDYPATSSQNVILGISSDNTNTDYTSYPIGISVNSTNNAISYILSGSMINSGISATIGDKYRIKRTAAGTITAEYSQNGGTTWSLVHDYTGDFGAFTAIVYPKADIESTSHYLVNPVGVGIL